MASTNISISKSVGLILAANSFDAPDGAYEQADNVVVFGQGVLRSRRGFKTIVDGYYIPDPTTLIYFADNLYVAHDDELDIVDREAGTTTTLSGDYPLGTILSKARYAAASGNLYLCSDVGVKKIENNTEDAVIIDAGTPRGLDLEVTPTTQGSIIDPDAQVAYRVVFGKDDQNNNTLIGAPTGEYLVTNSMITGKSFTRSTTTLTVTSTAHGLTGTFLVKIADSTDFDAESTVGTVTTADAFTIVVPNSGASSGTLSYGVFKDASAEFTLPSGLTTDNWFAIYRSLPTATEDVTPDGDVYLIEKKSLSSTNISDGYISYSDTTPNEFLSDPLYTNVTLEGSSQANDVPPFCRDICNWKGMMIYANTQDRYRLNLQLITTISSLFSNGNQLRVINKGGSVPATAAVWQSGTTVRYSLVTAGIVPTVAVNQYITFDGFANAENTGTYIITAVNAAYVEVTNANRTNNTKDETGVTTASTYPTRVYTAATSVSYDTTAGGDFKLTASTTTSVVAPIAATARSIVKTINRDSDAFNYAYYTSTGASSDQGQISFASKTFDEEIYVTVNAINPGTCFVPEIPLKAATVISKNDIKKNGLSISKTNEPDAVPLTNSLYAGAKSSNILRVIPLRDSVIIIKEDGVFAMRGESPDSLYVRLIDDKTICRAADTAAVLNNTVIIGLTNRGAVRVTEQGVGIISVDIKNKYNSNLGSPLLEDLSSAVAYESEGIYLMTTITTNATEPDIVWCYNVETQSWTNWDTYFNSGIVTPDDDKLYLLNTGGNIYQERKLYNIADYTMEECPFHVTSISEDGKTLTIKRSADFEILPGYSLVSNQVVARIDTVDEIDPTTVTVTLGSTVSWKDGTDLQPATYSRTSTTCTVTTLFPHSLETGDHVQIANATDSGLDIVDVEVTVVSDSVFTFTTAASGATTGVLDWDQITYGTVYEYINVVLKTTPLTTGNVNRMKHFTELQVVFKNRACSKVALEFSNEAVADTISGDAWVALSIAQGWGSEPWSQFDWGEIGAFETKFGTVPNQPVRTYIPLLVARGMYLQVKMTHQVATETFELQALGYTLRTYGPGGDSGKRTVR